MEGISAAEWVRLLSARVFFWLDQALASSLVHARAQRNRAHDMLALDTHSVIQRHGEGIELTAINTGTTLFPAAPKRGRVTFSPLNKYQAGQRVVELTVGYTVPDVGGLTLRVERWQAGRPREVVSTRSAPGLSRKRG